MCSSKFSYQCGEEEVVILSHHPHGQDLNRVRVGGVLVTQRRVLLQPG